MRLHPADVEQIARRVARLIVVLQPPPAGQFIDAAELARVLGIERDCLRARRRARRASPGRSAQLLAIRSTTRQGRAAGAAGEASAQATGNGQPAAWPGEQPGSLPREQRETRAGADERSAGG